MSEQWYLRMEAVNLCNFVYDTQDLSTIRGGGHILLSAVEEVAKEYKSFLEKISCGASVGLLAIKENKEAEDVVKEIRGFLATDDDFKHATFVVNAVKGTGADNYRRDLERLMAANRCQQMRSPSYAVPSDNSSSTVCEVDLIRPAVLSDSKGLISRSTHKRREKGKENKRKEFYQKISGYEVKGSFVNELDKLTGDSNNPLDHKMAVIYIDGNGFGKIQADKCKNRTSHENFDVYLSKKYSGLMHKILEYIDKDQNKTWLTQDSAYRLETLLWGGDERMWVVPAWKGWELLQFFFDHTRDWIFEDRRLTHAAGIVFCHHKAPIHRITALARGLADQVKTVTRSRNAFAYQILESFDHVGRDLAGFRAERCPSGETTASLVIGGNNMGRIAEEIRKLQSSEFSTSRLHRIVSSLLATDEPSRVMADELIKELKTEWSGSYSKAENTLDTLEPLLGGKRTMWAHLAELWNYIASEEAATC